MKNLILICSLLVTTGLAMDKRLERRDHSTNEFSQPPFPTNSSLCVFHHEFKTVMCHGPRGSVECDAVANVSSAPFRFFGIGKYENFNGTTPEFKYFLYPRNFENQTYYNYTTEVDGKNYEFYLYHSMSSDECGFRVTNFECYQKLVDVIQSSSDHRTVKMQASESTVTLFGEVFYFDKSVEKRWFWLPFYSYGWGYPYMWG